MGPDPQTVMRALHDEHAAALWSYCLRLAGGDRGRAEDLVQETLLRAWRRPAQLTDPSRPARAWLFTIARNLYVDQWRAQRVHPVYADPEPPTQPVDDEVDGILLTCVVEEALARLSDDHRAVLRECYYRQRSVAEAAALLGVPAGTVKSRLHYALRSLRLALEELGVTP